MSTHFDLVVFDLDGTLVETREDLAASVNYALRATGIPELAVETIVHFVGDGALKLIQRSLGENNDRALCDEVLEAFLGHYEGHCTEKSLSYPGVAEIIPGLSPLPLAVLTNKPAGPTDIILNALGLKACFGNVIGGDSEYGRKPDPAGLLAIISGSQVQPARTLLVGDTSVDVLTARNAGCQCAGVQYGFRPGDFIKDPPDYLLGEFSDLLKVL